MTKKQQHSITCPNCGHDVPMSSDFSLWLRDLPYPMDSNFFACHNLDYIWHNYPYNWFITIEEKTNGAKSTFSQKQTHEMLEKMLVYASKNVISDRGKPLEYKGHYIVSFQNTSPENSYYVDINGSRYTFKCVKASVLHLLQYGEMLDKNSCA